MIRSLEIRPVLNGFVVQVGCQVVVFTSREALLKGLAEYLENPEEVEMRYSTTALNAGILLRGVEETQMTQVPPPPPAEPCSRRNCVERCY